MLVNIGDLNKIVSIQMGQLINNISEMDIVEWEARMDTLEKVRKELNKIMDLECKRVMAMND